MLPRSRLGNYELFLEQNATPEMIREMLQGNDSHRLEFFAYSGHATREGLELLKGKAHLEGLAPILGDCKNLKAVLLNGCSTAGMVKEMLNNGVKVIIGTHASVDDHLAKDFAKVFFERFIEVDCKIQEAFSAAKNAVLMKNNEVEFETYRGISSIKNISQKSLWGIFYKEDDVAAIQSLNWKLPSFKTKLDPCLALPPARRGGDSKTLLAMVLSKKELEQFPEKPKWREATLAVNLCLLWGLSRQPIIGVCLVNDKQSAPKLYEALAWTEVLIREHDGYDAPVSICWLQMDITNIPAPRNIESFGQLLAEQDGELAKALAERIRFYNEIPTGFHIGIVTQIKDQWSYVEEWTNAFPDFSFVFVFTADDMQVGLEKPLKDLFAKQAEFKRECFFVSEKPMHQTPLPPEPERSEDERRFEQMIPILNKAPKPENIDVDQHKRKVVEMFLEKYNEKKNSPDWNEKKEVLQGIVWMENQFFLQVLKAQPESELPAWIQACMECNDPEIEHILFKFIGNSDANWDAYILAAKHSNEWLRRAANEYERQPDLFLAMLRRACRFPEEKETIFDMVHALFNEEDCALSCIEIRELSGILQTGDTGALTEYLENASFTKWNYFAKSGASLPHAYFSTHAQGLRGKQQPGFWQRIFRLPLSISLLREICLLDADNKDLFFREKKNENMPDAESFAQSARRNIC